MARQRVERVENDEARMARYSPFAKALQEWLWHGRGYDKPAWSRRRLAEVISVSYSTIDKWFSVGTMPEPEAFWALVEATGWEPETLRELTGYSELPPHVLGPWEFLDDHLERTEQRGRFDLPTRAKIHHWLAEARTEYNRLPKRPGRRKQRQAMATPADAPERPERPEHAERVEPHETTVSRDDEVTARRREQVGAGK